MKRREFFSAGVIVAVAARRAAAQGGGQQQTTFAPMDTGAYRETRLAPKPGAKASMDAAGRDELEHGIRCMCGCSLDVYTCRTTDFTCPISPAMHRDVLFMIDGGHTADEILDAFVGTYGERVRMAPKAEGFNWAGYLMPFVAMAAAATVVTMLLRKWTRTPATVAVAGAPRTVNASADELARLNASIRDDEDDEA